MDQDVSGSALDSQPLSLAELRYELPPERIASHPPADRESAKLCVARVETSPGTNGVRVAIGCTDQLFRDLPEQIPYGAQLVLNESRVFPARLLLEKPTGGAAEVLLLAPLEPSRDPALALAARSGQAVWQAMIRGKRIEAGQTLSGPRASGLRVLVGSRRETDAQVRVEWDETHGATLSELLERLGRTPLPPYLKREDTPQDRDDYQTVYAAVPGSVAAPTAGLHLTPRLLEVLERERGVSLARSVLHVGAGTFRPVERERIEDHTMHAERMVVRAEFVERLLAHERAPDRARRPRIAVGTTSLRLLESLFWVGIARRAWVPQWAWRHLGLDARLTASEQVQQSLECVLAMMRSQGSEALAIETQLMIVPGYRFRMCEGLITNFHQPESTLLALVAGWLGGLEPMRALYAHALAHRYRFLSYGDGSLLWRPESSY